MLRRGRSGSDHFPGDHHLRQRPGMVRTRPHRFPGFAILPLPDSMSPGELTPALKVLHPRWSGIAEQRIRSLFGNRCIGGDSTMCSVAARWRSSTQRCRPTRPHWLLDSHLDVPADTAWAVAQMHDKGVSVATADVKFVVSHAGGKVPCLARRFALIDEVVVAASQGRNA